MHDPKFNNHQKHFRQNIEDLINRVQEKLGKPRVRVSWSNIKYTDLKNCPLNPEVKF